MAALRFADLDLYALLDSDSDEARAFTTYLGYWVSLAEHIQENYGDDFTAAVLADLRRHRAFVRMNPGVWARASRSSRPPWSEDVDARRALGTGGAGREP